MDNKLLIIILIVIIVSIVLYSNYFMYNPINPTNSTNSTKIYETFADKYYKNPQDIIAHDGEMKFEYLKDPFFSKRIINKYYLNDDKKINGVKIHRYPYKNPVPNCASSADFYPNVYSANPSLHCRRNVKNNRTTWWWHKFDTQAVDLYNKYSVYR